MASNQNCSVSCGLSADSRTSSSRLFDAEKAALQAHESVFCGFLPGYPTVNYPARTAPPFTLNTSPVMKLACSVHKNSTGAAISSGVPARPRGMVCRISSPTLGSASAPALISVLTQPGATQFTKIPDDASSVESPFTMLISAPLV